MTHYLGEIIQTCRKTTVQNDAVAVPLLDRLLADDATPGLWEAYRAAQKDVWRIEWFRLGLSWFRPVWSSVCVWQDFDTEAEAQAALAELEASTRPMPLKDRLRVWVWELTGSLAECDDWLRSIPRRLWRALRE